MSGLSLNQKLIEYRKGYFNWLKIAYDISGYYIALIDYSVDFFKALGKLLLSIFLALTWPVWFIPFSYLDYKLYYKKLKKRFAECHVDLTDDYKPEVKRQEENEE